ncbi:FadR/GntR family transcriptional regulator [Bacillaceae bacterium]
MHLKPIKKRRLFEEIVLAIEQFIQEEQIRPGDKLPSEKELARIFNVSKTAVREAMSVLHANGVIETRPGAGIFLKETSGGTILQRVLRSLTDKTKLQEILEFRRALEVEAAALAALRATKEDLAAIREWQERLKQANEAGSLGIEEDYMFHYAIIIAAHNSLYQGVFDIVSDRFKELLRISKMQSKRIPGRFAETYKEHEKIIEALSKRNPDLAADTMRTHLFKNERKIWDNL